MLSAAGMLLLPCWVSRSIQRVCVCVYVSVWVFGAAAILMAMICKSERMAAAVVKLSCWSQCFVKSTVSLCSVCMCICMCEW